MVLPAPPLDRSFTDLDIGEIDGPFVLVGGANVFDLGLSLGFIQPEIAKDTAGDKVLVAIAYDVHSEIVDDSFGRGLEWFSIVGIVVVVVVAGMVVDGEFPGVDAPIGI